MDSFAVISDVHANLEALGAVLREIEAEKVEAVLFLGDSVGYGPDPNECVEMLRAKAQVMLAGNHDRAAAGLTDYSFFNPAAKAAIEWTASVLTGRNIEFLRSLPLTAELKENDIYLVHATPDEPCQWHYLTDELTARINFRCFEQRICLLGHSHEPFIAELTPSDRIIFHHTHTEINKKSRYIVNAGSAGQPRDGIPDAAYVLFRGNKVEIRRVSYDIVLTQNKMRAARLPETLIERLSAGR